MTLANTIPDALQGYEPAEPGPPPRPPRFYGLFRDREEAEAALQASLAAREFNYYVTWLDAGRDAEGRPVRYGLMATFAAWVGERQPYVNRLEAW